MATAHRTLSGAAIILLAASILAGCASPAAPNDVLGATPEPTRGPGAEPVNTSQRVSGTVQTVAEGKITLTDGQTLTLVPETSLVRIQPASSGDLQPQQYVAITAKRQPDGTLLASVINIFAESQRGLAPGQRPMDEGNLMTNGTIAGIDGDTFTATFPGGDATVKIAPDAKVQRFVPAGLEEITSGSRLTARVSNGVAQSITLQ